MRWFPWSSCDLEDPGHNAGRDEQQHRRGGHPGGGAVRPALHADQWVKSADPNFVVLQSHDGQNIQQVLGANRLNVDSGYRYPVRVTGYPDSANAPIAVTALTEDAADTAREIRHQLGL
jgi:hypothetical protein